MGATSASSSGGVCQPSFTALQQTAVQSQPVGLAIADYNGDGFLDYAVTNYVSGTVSLLFGQGDAGIDGGLAAAVTYDAGPMPRQLAAVDYNKDGKPDLVLPIYDSSTVGAGGPIVTWQNAGTWGNGSHDGFAPITAYGTPLDTCPGVIVPADLNQDGWPDLVFSDSCFRQIGFLLNNAGNGFSAPVMISIGADVSALEVADVNQDGWPDVVAVTPFSAAIQVLLNTHNWSSGGANGLAPPTVVTDNNTPTTLAAGDFNGDGYPDLAVIESLPLNGRFGLSVFLNQTDGGFGPRLFFITNSNPASVAVGDFNRDGKTDLVVAGANLFVLLNTGAWSQNGGDAGFGPLLFVDGGVTATVVQTQDLNGDGWPDLATLGGNDDGFASGFINTCGH